MVYIKFHIMLLILHAFTCLCWVDTQAPSARASVGQAHRHLRHACTRLCRAGRQAPSARMHAPLSGRHTGTFGTHARASVGQAHRHLRHACTHLSGRYLRGTLFNMSPWHVYHYPAYTLNGRHTLPSILFSMA